MSSISRNLDDHGIISPDYVLGQARPFDTANFYGLKNSDFARTKADMAMLTIHRRQRSETENPHYINAFSAAL
jgi:outer membrane receptor for monomeric catechols